MIYKIGNTAVEIVPPKLSKEENIKSWRNIEKNFSGSLNRKVKIIRN
jgi:hypothetical protein